MEEAMKMYIKQPIAPNKLQIQTTMEEMGEEDPSSPFWLQSTNTTAAARHRHGRRSRSSNASSFFLNTGVLVVLLLAAALVFLAIVIPSLVSLARQVFHPSSVKTSWNSLNIILVLFAIVCGFIGRRSDEDLTPVSSPMRREQDTDHTRGLRRRRLTRNSSSYPDLRQEEEESMWERDSQQWRFYDDMNLNNQRFEPQITHSSSRSGSRSQPHLDFIDADAKTIQVDNCVITSPEVSPPPPAVQEVESEFEEVEIDTPVSQSKVSPPDQSPSFFQPPSPTPPPSPATIFLPPPSPTTYLWPPTSPAPPAPPPPPPRRRAQPPAMSSRQQIEEIYETIGRHLPPPSPPPPPPPPPPPRRGSGYSDERKERSGKKRGGTTTKEFLVSFYHQTKRKKKHKRRSYENLDEYMEVPSKVPVSIHRSKSTPEFPPSLPSPPRASSPPPPPPPPSSVLQNLFSSSKTKKKVQSSRPPKEKRKATSSGNKSESTLIPKGKNTRSSSGGYSDGERSARGVMCPSPDVNIKADDFITKFREKLKLEKIDSIKQKQESGEASSSGLGTQN